MNANSIKSKDKSPNRDLTPTRLVSQTVKPATNPAVNRPIKTSSKLTVKPPVYNHPNKLNSKTITVEKSNYLIGNKNQPPKIVNNAPRVTIHNPPHKFSDDETSSLDVDKSGAELESESRDIQNLRNKLKELREKLFENRGELESFDFGKSENDESEFKSNVRDDDDEDDDSNCVIEVDNNMVLDESDDEEDKSDPSLVDGRRKNVITFAKKSNVDQNEKRKKCYTDFNVDSLDLKACKLIEKSESSLSDQIVSTDGLGTSQSSITSTLSTVSSNNTPDNTYPYKPEFLKYLESKTKSNVYVDKPLKPEDDILYQWRLKRKLEEAQKAADFNHYISFQNPNGQLPLQQQQHPQKLTSINIEPTSAIIQNEKAEKLENLPKNDKVSIETQTSSRLDTAIQTSLDSPVASASYSSSRSQSQQPGNGKILFKHDSSRIEIKLNKKEKPAKTAKLVASSPVKKKLHHRESSENFTNTSSDMTKVSALTASEATPLVTMAKTVTNRIKKTEENMSSINKSTSVSSSISSTISSLSSSITQITNRESPVHLMSKSSCSSSIQTITNKADDLVDIPLHVQQKQQHQTTSNRLKKNVDQYALSDDEDANNNELFESDEILQILFKKTYFYKTKLNQIDELLAKSELPQTVFRIK